MNQDDIDLVRSSFARLAPVGLDTGRLFYRHLFALAPDCRALFPQEIDAQAQKLVAMLERIVSGLDDPENLHHEFMLMGRRHVGYGALEEHYDAVGAALLRTLHEGLGEHWRPEIEDAWATVYGEMAEAMLSAADELTARN